MRIVVSFLAVLVFTLVVFGADARARNAVSYCERAQNTADIMSCVKKRHDEAQKKLNAAFDRVLENESAALPLSEEEDVSVEATESPSLKPPVLQEQLEVVRSTQKNWIAYRDQECEWERKLEDTESLKRIRQLSCITALTEQRLEILSLSLEHEENAAPPSVEDSATPRWMNALASDHPNVFWKYNDHLRADLDCNGTDEEIMGGLDVTSREARAVEADKFSIQSIVAITDNSATGRPKATLFDFSVLSEAGEGQVCGSNVKLSVVDYSPAVQSSSDDSESPVQVCSTALQIDDGKCALKLVHWNGVQYEVLPITAP